MSTPQKSKTHTFGKIAIIFGAVCFALSGLCTGVLAIPEYGKPPPGTTYGLYFSYWGIIAIGAFGFVPAAIVVLLGWITKKRGGNIWFTLAIVLISIWLVLVALFSIITLIDYF